MRRVFDPAIRAERVRLGRELGEARRALGMSQVALASELNINQVSISALELGNSDHNYDKVRAYLDGRTVGSVQPPKSRTTLDAIRTLVRAVDAAEATYRAALTRRNYDEDLEFAGSDWQAAQQELEGACVAYVRDRLGLPAPVRPRVEPEPLHRRSGGIRAALVGSCPLPQRDPEA